ncbi:uncharacterized protein LOC126554080 [Aphis gossypii]|uniref:uncharacterized protein LOC126554080 n=1 Tax=Aphis gossypii TaxID=80765 RepID=UPI002159959E|nr:uncharacterized protein LOC126554080 [Aphis gossypii]
MWSIVHFDADNSVEPIPTHWLNKNKSKCAWPNNDSSADRLRNNREKSNEFDFSYFSCRVLTNNISSLADAVKKVKLAMYTSDLSDIEDKKTKTNKHTSEKKRKDISLSSKNPSEQLNNALKLVAVTNSNLSDYDTDESSEKSLFDDSDNDKNYELPIADCSKKSILNYDSENDEQNNDTLTAVNSATLNQHGICLDEHKKSSTLNITPISKKYTTPSRVVFQKVTDTQNVTPSTSNHQNKADIQNVQVAYLTNDVINTPSVSPLVNSNEQHLNFQKLILKYLTSLKVEVSNISDTQQVIIKLVNNIQNKTQVDDSWANEIDYFVSSWPISDHDGLNDMENKIKSDSNFRKQVVNELARIGGKS